MRINGTDLNLLVRRQIKATLPAQECPMSMEDLIDYKLNAMSHVELLKRISDALENLHG